MSCAVLNKLFRLSQSSKLTYLELTSSACTVLKNYMYFTMLTSQVNGPNIPGATERAPQREEDTSTAGQD